MLGTHPTQVFGEVRYRLNTLSNTPVWLVRYELDTGARHFGNFGTPTKNTPGYRYTLGNLITAQVAGTPPLHNVGFKKNIAETLNNVGHPTRCLQPLNSVRLMVSYIVQCLDNIFLSPHCARGGRAATCVSPTVCAAVLVEGVNKNK